ncbi:hypothetical protein [Streptomyces europaeiscabiei]|uniref:hypothetical protein n=1 Tax=Streptomyces europaeiscabiei TaxID=146819 RepID=UPI0029A839A7|nr:hypothetical protein [Streptomyces europaeiscabiei]MDX3670696.1 hypothetical protein [Streptomyces europaeiscabiei]MDX3845845.1 hypothetical protein [Streptomyces europaeiscabiei]
MTGELAISGVRSRPIMILVMTVQNSDKTLSRKQRLQEKQRRQLAVVDTVDKAEVKVRKAEAELAVAVTEAVQMFGDEQSASEALDMSAEAIRRFLRMAQDEAAGTGHVAEVAEGAESAAAS